jgi:CubicO group peptidase (beta-lactamase class C family)
MQRGIVRLAKVDNRTAKCANAADGDGANAIDRRYGLASMTKSITATIFGFANADLPADKKLRLDEPVTRYLPSLTQMAAVPVGDVLQMASGIRWNDERHGAELKGEAIDRADVPGSPTLLEAVKRILAAHRRSPPGHFNYSAVDSTIVGLLAQEGLQRLGQPPSLARALESWIWQVKGMRDTLRWKVDPGGTPAPWCCSYATPRDLAVLGDYLLGVLLGKDTPARQDWMREATRLHQASAESCEGPAGSFRLGYGYQWWVFQSATGAADPALGFTALGKGGQFLHLFPASGVVVLQLSDWSDQMDGWSEARACASYAAQRSIERYLAAQP